MIKSYPGDQLKESIRKVCRDEYGIEEVDVKIVGNTLGVYLPLQQLFAADFKEAAVTGKVRNLETLFEPSAEAMEKVEDVLFAISRVLLSTDRKLDFYVLQATDVEKTGMQLILSGYVDDIRRVRIWDISRDEYRKRVVHELRLNRAVMWHQPIRTFFNDLESLTANRIQTKYFSGVLPLPAIQSLFFDLLLTDSRDVGKRQWEVMEIRSTPIQRNEALIYTKSRVTYQESPEAEPIVEQEELQYLFLLSLVERNAQIIRIIPFQYLDESGQMQRVPFPEELQVENNVEQWEEEFPVKEILLGPFLAQQLTRRIQGLLAQDERIRNTFREAKLSFEYIEEAGVAKPHFSLDLGFVLRDFNNYTRDSAVMHEDILYLLNVASREFVKLLRSYRFGEYNHLKVSLSQDANSWIIGREDLELFRRKKVDLKGLLTVPV